MSSHLHRVAVLGLGLIGGSLHARHSPRRAGRRRLRHRLLDHRGGRRAAGFPVAPNDAAAVRGADLVVLAMPLPQVRGALSSLAPHLAGGPMLTDVGTLKLPVLDAVRDSVPQARFVGGHPLAGTEDSGWGATDPMLFRDAPWTLCIEPDTDLDAWLAVAELVCDLGAKPVPATAAEQDAAVARVIGLPHVLAEALALTGLAGGPLGLSLAAGSYLRAPEWLAPARTSSPPGATATPPWSTRSTTSSTACRRLAATWPHDGSVLPLAEAGHAHE